ncbi:hypothetical protein HMPREF0322_02868 [Desulfitobacterium hafniense DP7]|uniref:Uncharacterized protein n=1 Tax=Desulfitobacterium hafniense DP7 TaxID=537010 RepID=G9XPH2_DESHA|nr:hypothetical protein HMPREF0322_02868 [Desulfitobacterium hafniense DP7]
MELRLGTREFAKFFPIHPEPLPTLFQHYLLMRKIRKNVHLEKSLG